MIVLVDTSVWFVHFKQRNEHLVELLEAGLVVCHPYAVVEVSCGTPPSRRAIVKLLTELELAPVAPPDELLALIERRSIGLLASALLSDQALVWTSDKWLEAVAVELGHGYRPALQS